MILERVMEVLAPASCLTCGQEGDVVCTTCLRQVAVSRGLLGPADLPPDSLLAGVSVGADYTGVVKELIWQLKFFRMRAAAEVAATLILRRADDWPDVAVVSSVPVAAGRYRERGYNQSELVARAVARRIGLPYSSLLARTSTTHQIGLGRHDRLAQVAGAFFALRRLEGQRVLLVDDVVTTGATLSECARVLREAGAGAVWGAAVARH